MSLNTIIDQFKVYVDLTESDIEIIAQKFDYIELSKGDYLVKEGEICRMLTYIVTGATRTYHINKQGHEHTIVLADDDWWTTDFRSFLKQTPSNFNIQCVKECKLFQISYNKREELLKEIPKLELCFRKRAQMGLIGVQKRLIRNLSMTALERYLYIINERSNIEEIFPQYMVASYLGITKEFFSAIKKEALENKQ